MEVAPFSFRKFVIKTSMRKVFSKSLFVLLCVASTANAGKKAPLNLIPAYGPPATGHILRLHQRLLVAAESGDIGEVKKLLAMGADINVIEDFSKTHTPLTYAAENGNITMTRFLLAHGADHNNPEAFFRRCFGRFPLEKPTAPKYCFSTVPIPEALTLFMPQLTMLLVTAKWLFSK